MQFVFSWKSTLGAISYEDGNKLLEVVALRLGEIRLLVLSIDRQKQQRERLVVEVIDHPHSSSFAFSAGCPAEFTDAAGFRNHVADVGVGPNELDQFRPLLFVEQIRGLPKEERRLNHRHWGGTHLRLNNTLLAHRGKILAHNDKRSD